MRATLARFLRLTAGYSLVTLVGPIFTVLLTPLYTRVLAPADYGVVEAVTTLAAFVNTFVLLSLDQALGAHFYDERGPDAPAYQRRLVATALALTASLAALAAAGLVLAARPVALALFKDAGRAPLIWLIALGILVTPIYSVLVAGLRLQMRVRPVNWLGLTYLFAFVGSSVLLILGLGFRASGVVAASVIANALGAGLGLVLAGGMLLGRPSPALLPPLLRTGLSLLPGAYSFLVLAGVDRLLLTQFVSQTDLGLYSIANKLASMLYVLLGAAWQAWWPLALQLAGQPSARQQYARMLEYLGALTMSLALALGLFAPEILAFFTRDVYVPAAPYALGLMIYTGPLGFAVQLFFIALYIEKRTQWISAAYLLAAAANVVLNLWLDPVIGVWGAVWATVGAAALLAVMAYSLGQRFYPIPYRLGRLAGLSLVYLALVGLMLARPALMSLPLKVGALALFAAAVLALRIVTPRQLAQGYVEVRGFIGRRLAAGSVESVDGPDR
jgi:O-antigen/teichoic acid export membrane protein